MIPSIRQTNELQMNNGLCVAVFQLTVAVIGVCV